MTPLNAKAKTGVRELDFVLDGGLPRRSVTLVCGGPGTGKTILSFQFMVEGAREGETGVYVTFGEERATLMQNMSAIGYPLHELEEKNLVNIMDLLTVRESGLNATFETILDKLEEVDASRLVIDSYSVISQIFREKINARIMLHSILRKLLCRQECTTIITSEGENLQDSMEAYVSDAILVLRKKEISGRQLRELEIVKMRGSATNQHKFIFTLDGGFRVIRPYDRRPAASSQSEFESGCSFSDLFRTRQILVELGSGVQPIVPLTLFLNLSISYLKQGCKALIASCTDFEPSEIFQVLKSATDEESALSNVEIVNSKNVADVGLGPFDSSKEDPFGLKSILQDWSNAGKKYVLFSDLGCSAWSGVSEEHLNTSIEKEEISPPELDFRVIPRKDAAAFPQQHKSFYRVTQIHNSLVIHGLRPHSPPYALEFDFEEPASMKMVRII